MPIWTQLEGAEGILILSYQKPLPSLLTLFSITFVSIMAESSAPPLAGKQFCVKIETVREVKMQL